MGKNATTDGWIDETALPPQYSLLETDIAVGVSHDGFIKEFPTITPHALRCRNSDRASRISTGRGGQPGIRTSTGTWRSTGPVTA